MPLVDAELTPVTDEQLVLFDVIGENVRGCNDKNVSPMFNEQSGPDALQLSIRLSNV